MKRKTNRLKMVMAFKCPQCDDLYEEELDAIYCCGCGLDTQNAWRCGKCHELHETKKEAQDCCRERRIRLTRK